MSEALSVKNETYISAVQNALFTFQMIEEALKICIGLSYEIIGFSTPPPVAFNFDTKAIINAPLGKLTKLYSSVSANNHLVAEIKKIEEWRNFCAHGAFTHEFLQRGTANAVSIDNINDIQKVISVSVKIVEQLGAEIIALRTVHAELSNAK